MTIDEFRQMALTIPDAIEAAHVDHPDFRVGGKVFASLGVPGEDWGMVKLTPAQQVTFIEKAPKGFRPCSGAWGQRGYTNVHLPSAAPALVRTAIELASKNVVAGLKKRTAR